MTKAADGISLRAPMHFVLEELQQEIRAALEGLSAEETQLRPLRNPAKWSMQQVVEHLFLTYVSSGEVIAARVLRGTPTKALPTIWQRVGQCAVLQCGYFPTGRKAPAVVDPPVISDPLPGRMLVEKSGELLRLLDELCVEAESLFGERRAISHAVLGPLSASQWRRFHLVHGVHHLRQVMAIRTGRMP